MTLPPDADTSPAIPAAMRRPTLARAPSCRVVDTSSRTNSMLRGELRRLGYAGVIRYVPLPGVNPALDITAEELDGILGDGMGSWWVQHCRYPGWHPGLCDPEADALHAVQFAKAAGYAPGTHGFVDAEGMATGTTEDEAFAYNTAWCHVVVSEGFSAGIYVGYQQPQSAASLYAIHDASSYWSDMGHRVVAQRGCAVHQEAEIHVLGVSFDPNTIGPDLRGETPLWTFAGVASVA